jgi:hypothetical protein
MQFVGQGPWVVMLLIGNGFYLQGHYDLVFWHLYPKSKGVLNIPRPMHLRSLRANSLWVLNVHAPYAGADFKIHLPVTSVDSLNQTEPATFSIVPCRAFFRDSFFSLFEMYWSETVFTYKVNVTWHLTPWSQNQEHASSEHKCSCIV